MTEMEARKKCALDILKFCQFDVEDENLKIIKGSKQMLLEDKKVWLMVWMTISAKIGQLEFECYRISENSKDKTPEYRNHKEIQALLSEMNRRLAECIKKSHVT